MDAFVESGMTFGPFDDASIFRIEKSQLLQRCSGAKTVEFILNRRKTILLFVEAKSSSPVNRVGNETNYQRFLNEITEKFLDSFELFMAGLLERRNGHEQIPEALKKADYKSMRFRFVLIIKGHEDTWLPPLKEELDKKMKSLHKVWDSQIVVLNDKLARENHLIT